MVGLIGESGSGKTSLARGCWAWCPSPEAPSTVDGHEVSGFTRARWRAFRRAGHRPVRVPGSAQQPRQALHRARLGARGRAPDVPRPAGGARAAEEALRTVGLGRCCGTPARRSSPGGQRQRVAIARALAVEPELLVCDEPVSALDASSRIEVVRTLEAAARAGTGILLISHDLSSLGAIADRVLVLHEGGIVESGTAAEVLGAPRHPYTRRLIDAIPTLERNGERAAVRPTSH